MNISICVLVHHLILDGTTIDFAANMRDFGVIIDSDLKFHFHTNI